MTLSLIAAVARNGVVGHRGKLLWSLPDDQRFFKCMTLGCPVIMGRKTWDSLPGSVRPLPGRRNIIVSRNSLMKVAQAEVVHSLDAAIELVQAAPKVFVIGGGELYRQALPLADELVLTEIDRDFDGDTHFPVWDRGCFSEVKRERRKAITPMAFHYAFVTYERKIG